MIFRVAFFAGFFLAVMPTVCLSAPLGVQVSGSGQTQRHMVVFIVSIQGTTAIVRKRNGKELTVDISQAQADQAMGVLAIGNPGAVILYGWRGIDKVFHVSSVGHSNPTVSDDAADDDQ